MMPFMKSPLSRLFYLVMAIQLIISPASAQGYFDWSCRDLWVERNQIFKDAGYCFNTRRAIEFFGNRGCIYDRQEDVPLSQRQRQVVAAIIRAEQTNRCPR